jgi:hypothetical protein
MRVTELSLDELREAHRARRLVFLCEEDSLTARLMVDTDMEVLTYEGTYYGALDDRAVLEMLWACIPDKPDFARRIDFARRKP